MSPLHLAAQNGHEKIVEMLVNNNNEILNAQTVDGCTALHLGAQNGKLNQHQILFFLKTLP